MKIEYFTEIEDMNGKALFYACEAGQRTAPSVICVVRIQVSTKIFAGTSLHRMAERNTKRSLQQNERDI